MPVWHENTDPLVKAGKLAVVGIVQEQHPRRAKLFMQWKQMDWPIMVDSFNLLDVGVVPITVFVDEFGIVRKVKARPDDLDEFLTEQFEPRPTANTTSAAFDPNQLASLGFQKPTELNTAIEMLGQDANDKGRTHFRRGVALRMRFESEARQPGDFAAAIDAWEKALAQNPNQYIWRRRIQQYGPRLDKPYPFYDWVAQAEKEISDRGEAPVTLDVPLSGAEIAQPAVRKKSVAAPSPHPDPTGKVRRDGRYVRIESTVVRSTDSRSPAALVHLELQMNPTGTEQHPEHEQTKWNDEGGPVAFAVDEGQALVVGPIFITSSADSVVRRIEFEVSAKDNAPLPEQIKGAVFYPICIGPQQQCVFLRQDVTLPLTTRTP